MPLTRREHQVMPWPGEMLRRFFEGEWGDGTWLRVEQFTDDGEMVVKAEIPGIDPEKDIEITALGDTLRIRAERKESSESTTKEGYRSEFRYGSFERVLPLPAGVDPDAVKATYEGGILTVRAPLPAEAEKAPRVVPVSTPKA